MDSCQKKNDDLAKGRESYLLSINAIALKKSLRVGVGEAVVVPQGAGWLQELSLCCALVISKETLERKIQHFLHEVQIKKILHTLMTNFPKLGSS